MNKLWLGKKTDSAEYRKWNSQGLRLLPDYEIPDGPIHLVMQVYFKSKLSDLDNSFKGFIDLLQKRYGFNDRDIHKITARKLYVDNKEDERIEFCLEPYTGPMHANDLDL